MNNNNKTVGTISVLLELNLNHWQGKENVKNVAARCLKCDVIRARDEGEIVVGVLPTGSGSGCSGCDCGCKRSRGRLAGMDR